MVKKEDVRPKKEQRDKEEKEQKEQKEKDIQDKTPSPELVNKMQQLSPTENFLKKPYEQLNCDSYSKKIDKTFCIHYNISQNIKKKCKKNKECYLNTKDNIDKFTTYFVDSKDWTTKIPKIIEEGSKITECKTFYDAFDATRNFNNPDNNLKRAYCAKALSEQIFKKKSAEEKKKDKEEAEAENKRIREASIKATGITLSESQQGTNTQQSLKNYFNREAKDINLQNWNNDSIDKEYTGFKERGSFNRQYATWNN